MLFEIRTHKSADIHSVVFRKNLIIYFRLLLSKMSSMCLDTEIRKLKPIELYRLGTILTVSGSWKKLMASVPKQENVCKFSNEHIKMIEQAAHQHNRNAAEIFLDEWGTMGKKRPTLGLLLDLLIKTELFRAADYIACDILQQDRPKRPEYGPIASVDTSDAAINKILEEQILPKDMFDDSLVSESLFKLDVNKIYLGDKKFDDLQEAANANSTKSTDTLNSKKSTNAASEIVSNLMKFTITDSCKVTDNMAHTVVSVTEEQLPVPIIICDPKDSSNTRKQNCQEVTSQELPVFVNSPVQSAVPNEEVSSKHLPVFLNNSVQPIVSNEEASSEYLPVFLNNSVQSSILSYEEISSSDIPLCLKR